jgi:PAS domain-containing protein
MTLVSELLEYKRIFESAPALFLLLDKNPEFTILDASDAYLRATRKQRQAIVGRPIFDVFPDNPDEEGTRPSRPLQPN